MKPAASIVHRQSLWAAALVPDLDVCRGRGENGGMVSRGHASQGGQPDSQTDAGADRAIHRRRRPGRGALDPVGGRAMNSPEQIRAEILRLTREYSHKPIRAICPAMVKLPRRKFVPGETVVPVCGPRFRRRRSGRRRRRDAGFLADAGQGRRGVRGEPGGVSWSQEEHSRATPAPRPICWRFPRFPAPSWAARRLKPGDEIITVAAGFPTTVAPILQNGFVPVFIDNDPVDPECQGRQLEEAFAAGQNQGGHSGPHAGQSVRPRPP